MGEAPGEVGHLPPVRDELARQVLGAALHDVQQGGEAQFRRAGHHRLHPRVVVTAGGVELEAPEARWATQSSRLAQGFVRVGAADEAVRDEAVRVALGPAGHGLVAAAHVLRGGRGGDAVVRPEAGDEDALDAQGVHRSRNRPRGRPGRRRGGRGSPTPGRPPARNQGQDRLQGGARDYLNSLSRSFIRARLGANSRGCILASVTSFQRVMTSLTRRVLTGCVAKGPRSDAVQVGLVVLAGGRLVEGLALGHRLDGRDDAPFQEVELLLGLAPAEVVHQLPGGVAVLVSEVMA